MVSVSEENIKQVGTILRNVERPLKERFRALFTLKNLGGETCISEISSAFSDSSALLKHELAYCLGQMGDKRAIPILIKVLEDITQEPVVRHEAAEALGAIGCPSIEVVLQKFTEDASMEVSQTCQLALRRLQWLKHESNSINLSSNGPFPSIDPSPPLEEININVLENILLNESVPLFDRYRAMFSLRNLNSGSSAKVLAKGLTCSSALFRHEIAFVLGQMAKHEVTLDLAQVVKNKREHEMVRHEAAEALGSIANEEAVAVLTQFLNDEARIVKESCQIALDISHYENSSEFQYADGLFKSNTSEM